MRQFRSKAGTGVQTAPYHIKAVLFDFDGTLTRSGALDFAVIRKSLDCPQGVPILEFIKTLDDDGSRRAAQDLLDAFEIQGARDSVPNAGAQEVIAWLKRQGLAVGVITRNSRASVIRALENFDRLGAEDFDVLITRDDPLAPKPSGEGVVWAARQLDISTGEILVVGDFIFDAQAGQAAGALTALLDPNGEERLQTVSCDFRIHSLEQVAAIVSHGEMP